MSLVKDQDNHDTMGQLTDTMGNWANHEAEKSRRRVEENGGGLAHEWMDYIDTLEERYGAWSSSNSMAAASEFRRIYQNKINLIEKTKWEEIQQGGNFFQRGWSFITGLGRRRKD